MTEQIKKILDDIYAVDPELKNQESDIMTYNNPLIENGFTLV